MCPLKRQGSSGCTALMLQAQVFLTQNKGSPQNPSLRFLMPGVLNVPAQPSQTASVPTDRELCALTAESIAEAPTCEILKLIKRPFTILFLRLL